jgi:hypothetical protein
LAEPSEKICFIISPIGKENTDTRRRADRVLQYIVNPVLKELGYKPIRGDQIYQTGSINRQVIRHIKTAPLVIADLTESNPNVYYELAIRHTLRRPVVHLIQEPDEPLFDIADIRVVKFNFEVDRVKRAKTELKAHMKDAENKPRIETPVSIALNYDKLSEIETDFDRQTQLLTIERGDEKTAEFLDGEKFPYMKNHWFHVKVRNIHSDEKAVNCIASIMGVKNVETGKEMSIPDLELKWQGTTDARISILPGRERQFDAFIVPLEKPNKIYPGLNWSKVEFSHSYADSLCWEGPGIFDLTYTIQSENFSIVAASFRLEVGDKLSDIKFERIG